MKALFQQGNDFLKLNLIGPRSRLKEILKWLSDFHGLKFQGWVKD